MRAILAARNSRHELWDQNRFTNTWHLEPVNVSKHHILGPKTNQIDLRQPFNVFRSQISFLFCSKIIQLFRSINSLRNMCNKFAYHFDVAGKSSANQTLQLLYLLKWSSRSVKWRKTCDFVPSVLFWVFVFSSDGSNHQASVTLNNCNSIFTSLMWVMRTWSWLGTLRIQGAFRKVLLEGQAMTTLVMMTLSSLKTVQEIWEPTFPALFFSAKKIDVKVLVSVFGFLTYSNADPGTSIFRKKKIYP